MNALGDHRGKHEATEPEPVSNREHPGAVLEILGNRRERLVHAERHVPGHGREDQENDGELEAHRVALERRHEEHEGGREETEDRDALEDVQERKHDEGRPLAQRHRGPVRDRKYEGEEVRGDHPGEGEDRQERKRRGPGRTFRIQDRERDPRNDENERDPPESLPGRRH